MTISFLRKIILFFVTFHVYGCSENKPSTDDLPISRPNKIDPDPSTAYLSPEESMRAVQLPPGYHLELVAAEPDIQEPVAIVWDGNGRMFVAQMRSYMQDINGTGRDMPIGRISMLEDTDDDGRMDRSSVFIDSLVLPRMIMTLDDRLVVNETYSHSLHSYRDTGNDGVADEKKVLYENTTRDTRNLEHQKSGLVWNIDNWLYVSNPVRFRYTGEKLVPDSLGNAPTGQWGVANDDFGRLFFSFAGGEVPALGFQQNPAYGPLDMDDQLDKDFSSVWPVIGTPDVEGGPERQREDGSLNHFSASCGQTVFRGDHLPAAMKGDLFICEPAGRLIRRAKINNDNGKLVLSNAYDKAEFIASTDMNFRPVNMATGPDGCLYIVDMYRGIIQESQWTGEGTTIRKNIIRKNLDKNIGRGRIYRVVHDDFGRGKRPALLDAGTEALVDALSHPNGWWRENAQKLIIVRNDTAAIPLLKKLALGKRTFPESVQFWKQPPDVLARLHALWTLEGLNAVDKNILLRILNDKHPELRKAAVRIGERFLEKDDHEFIASLDKMKTDTAVDVRIQLLLSLRSSREQKVKQIMEEIALSDVGNALLQKIAKKSLVSENYLDELKKITKGRNEFHTGLILDGAEHYIQLCANCHGADGRGLSSAVAPPLAGSPRVNGDPERLIKILLNGLSGPIDGKTYPADMPAMRESSNEYIAAVLSYIRTALGNEAGVIEPADVRKVRK